MITDEVYVEIELLRKHGMSLRKIAEEVGCAVNTVRSHLAVWFWWCSMDWLPLGWCRWFLARRKPMKATSRRQGKRPCVWKPQEARSLALMGQGNGEARLASIVQPCCCVQE